MGLTRKQEGFVSQYLVDLNATQAAYRAGYRGHNTGYMLMQREDVVDAIAKAMKGRMARTELTQDRVLKALSEIAFTSACAFVKVEDGRVVVRDTDTLPPEARAAIASIKETKYGITVTTYDRVRALEMLGKHMGMFTDRINVTGDVGVQIVDDIG